MRVCVACCSLCASPPRRFGANLPRVHLVLRRPVVCSYSTHQVLSKPRCRDAPVTAGASTCVGLVGCGKPAGLVPVHIATWCRRGCLGDCYNSLPPLVVTRCWTTESFPVQKAPEEQPVIGAQRAAPVGPTNTTAFELPFHYYLGFTVRLLLGFATHDNCWGFRTSGLLSIACTRVACPPHNVMKMGCCRFVIPNHSSSHRQPTGKTCEGMILSQ